MKLTTTSTTARQQRRPLSVARHHAWRESLTAQSADDFDDLVVVDPHEAHAPSRRSDKDLGEFLSLLDSLETGNDRKESTR